MCMFYRVFEFIFLIMINRLDINTKSLEEVYLIFGIMHIYRLIQGLLVFTVICTSV